MQQNGHRDQNNKMGGPTVPDANAQAKILGSETELNGVLFVLFIPSKDQKGKDLRDQDMWANAAGDMLTNIFGGSTEMPPAKGKWLNDKTKEIITEKIILIHSYARESDANNEDKIRVLASFLHRMGKETNQGEVAVVIDGVFHRIRKFNLIEVKK